MIIKTLNGVSPEEILEVFNNSFSDYFVPFHLTIEQLRSKLISEKIDLNLSVGAFNNERLVGFMLHGFDIIDDKRILYNAGTGVIPQGRGQGLTKRMYSFVLPKFMEQRIDEVVLEVISKNVQAIKSYEASGFEVTRELACYKGEVKASDYEPVVEIKVLENYNWKMMQSFWDKTPTWQNSKNVVINLIDKNYSIGAFINNQLVGYLVFNPSNKRIQQIAVDKDQRRKKIGLSLIKVITEEFGSELSIINVDKISEPINMFLKKIGLINYIDQLEMRLKCEK